MYLNVITQILIKKGLLSNGLLTMKSTNQGGNPTPPPDLTHRNDMVHDYLNNRLPPNVTLSPHMMQQQQQQQSQQQPQDEYKSLLDATAAASSVVAPNVQVKPSDSVFPSMAPMPMSHHHAPAPPLPPPINIASLLNDLKEIEVIQSGESPPLTGYLDGDHKDACVNPRRLKTTDIDLIEKISIGQFSSVWKGKCRRQERKEGDLDVAEYAVKVFAGHQKSAWVNERDIYNLLSTTNEFILAYYGSDVHEKGRFKLALLISAA